MADVLSPYRVAEVAARYLPRKLSALEVLALDEAMRQQRIVVVRCRDAVEYAAANENGIKAMDDIIP